MESRLGRTCFGTLDVRCLTPRETACKCQLRLHSALAHVQAHVPRLGFVWTESVDLGLGGALAKCLGGIRKTEKGISEAVGTP